MDDVMIKVKNAVVDLDIDAIQPAVQACLDKGIPAWEIIGSAMSEGMKIVGEKFESGEYFLADLIMSGEVLKEGTVLLEGKIAPGDMGKKGKVIIATVKGDIHDIGKEIVGMMLSAAGFEVINLGSDVHEDKIVEAVKNSGAQKIALSVLLTTMIGSIRDVVDALKKAGLRDKVKIAIGGACTYEKLATEMGVDAYGADAVQAVRIFEAM
jgi:5-methyltetrahydrofolate--homocysteine methyltransferase